MSQEKKAVSDKQFSIVKRAESFTHAWRGIGIFLKGTHNAWVDVAVLIAVIAAGIVLGISRTDWLFIVFAAGLVFTAEAFNTAIEIDIDLTSPEYHPFARDTKDVAAGAVLLAAIAAAIIGFLVFIPHVLPLL
jgi:diacylglycerol kinase (ATP)